MVKKKFSITDLMNNQSKIAESTSQVSADINKITEDINTPSSIENNSGKQPAEYRTPDIIAIEINSIKDQTIKIALNNSIEIGRRLTEAKELLPHGDWGTWLECSVEYSRSTANNLMRLFKEYGSDQLNLFGNTKSQALGNLSYTQAIALLGIPSEQREDFIKENDIDNMSSRELQKVIKEKQDLEIKLKATEDKVLDINNKNKEILTNKEVEIENLKLNIQDIQKHTYENKSYVDIEEAERLKELLNNTESELIDSNIKIQELEEKLRARPIEIIAEPQDNVNDLRESKAVINRAEIIRLLKEIVLDIDCGNTGTSFDIRKACSEAVILLEGGNADAR